VKWPAISVCLLALGCTRHPGLQESAGGGLRQPRLQEFRYVMGYSDPQGDLLKLTRGPDALFVQKINADEAAAKTLNEKRAYALESVYREAPSPYPGLITNVIKCDEKLKLKKSQRLDEAIRILAFDAFANDRFTFGACIPGQVAYRAFDFLIHCPSQKKFYDVKLFLKNGDGVTVDALMNEFACAG
jgi:hypothetical protein